MERDGKTKVELDGELKRPVEDLDIKEGMPMKLGSIWKAPKGATFSWSSLEEPGIAKSSKASRLVGRLAPLDIPSID